MYDVKNCSHDFHGCSFFLEIVREKLIHKFQSRFSKKNMESFFCAMEIKLKNRQSLC